VGSNSTMSVQRLGAKSRLSSISTILNSLQTSK